MSATSPTWQSAGYPMPVTTGFDFPDFDVATTIGAVSGVYATSLGIGAPSPPALGPRPR